MSLELDRREVFTAVAALGLGNLPFQRALAAQAQPMAQAEPVTRVTAEMVKNAEWIAGITLSDAERQRAAASLTNTLAALKPARAVELPNSVVPAIQFQLAAPPMPQGRGSASLPKVEAKKPEKDEDLAFASIPMLAHLLRSKQISSVELTKFFLARLKKYNPTLLFAVTITEELALKQAKAADEALAKNQAKGPLHGIPWGAKDLIAYPGYPTTWGAGHYEKQVIEEKATVAAKLDAAGAVLVAKLTLGALAWGDQWFGGMTRNPWNPKFGSSGSSAGSCSAVAAGCVPFAIGSETLGSIVSPSRTCGVTGLRPTYGRVDRTGCMTLCWSMDKLGPITRSAEDAALVFDVIRGPGGSDQSTIDAPFNWPGTKKVSDLRIGYFELNEAPGYEEVIDQFKKLGAKLVPVKLPSPNWLPSLKVILDVEAATAFDPLTRAGVATGIGLWPNSFRQAQLISAVEYLRANRLRTLLASEMVKVMEPIDLYIGGNDLQITNLTGHPTICVPYRFLKVDGFMTPRGITMTGKLFGETDLLTAAHAYQNATSHHLQRPPLDGKR